MVLRLTSPIPLPAQVVLPIRRNPLFLYDEALRGLEAVHGLAGAQAVQVLGKLRLHPGQVVPVYGAPLGPRSKPSSSTLKKAMRPVFPANALSKMRIEVLTPE